MTRTFVAVVTAVLALLVTGPAAADPLRCVVVYDENGNPTHTVCAPWPGR